MYKVKIDTIVKEHVQADGSDQLAVTFHLLDNKKQKVATYTHGFPFDTTEKELTEELLKVAQTYQSDTELAERQEPIDKMHRSADKLIETLEGKTL